MRDYVQGTQPEETLDAGTATPDVLSAGKSALPNVLNSSSVTAAAVAATELGPEVGPVMIEKHFADSPNYWGGTGEQDLGFQLGRENYVMLLGPSGAGGHDPSGHGEDALAAKASPTTGVDLTILDNKNTGMPKRQGKSSFFTDKPGPKLETMLEQVRLMDFPQESPVSKADVVDKLTDLVNVVNGGGGKVPDGVSFKLTNAGGFAQEPTEGLQDKFFAATQLTDSQGKPLRVGFLDFNSASETAERIALVKALGRPNPRGPTTVDVLEPVALGNIFDALPSSSLGGRVAAVALSEPGLLFGLDLLKHWGGAGIDMLQEGRKRQALDEHFPEIAQRLSADPKVGVLLVAVNWQPESRLSELQNPIPDERGPGDPTFVRWEKAFAATPDEAFTNWAEPPKWEEDRRDPEKWIINQRKKYDYFWFDGKSMTRYKPSTH